MKTGFAVILLSTMSITIAAAQSVHSVLPGTRGNTIELTIANESRSTPAENISMSISRHPTHLIFASTEQVIQSIGPRHATTAAWTFDVDQSAPVNTRDTLEFQITEKSGNVWTKSIVVQYSGPTTFALEQNYPNPFNPSTTIQYQLPVDSRVSLKVYDVLGREVVSLVDEVQPAGFRDVRFDAGNVASGIYYYRIIAHALSSRTSFQSVKKLLLVR